MFNRKILIVVSVLLLAVLVVPSLGAQFRKKITDEQFLELCKKGNVQEVINAIKSGANVNAKNKDGGTALMLAAMIGHTEIVNALIKAGADVNVQEKDGVTALMLAAIGHTEIVNALIKAGADVNVQEKDGRTALMLAAIIGHTEIVNALIEAGADDLTCNEGGTALIYASFNNHSNAETVKALIVAGSDVKHKDNNGRTALMGAAKIGNTKIVNALIKAGADVNAKDNNGITALMYAAAIGRTETVNALIEAGADDLTSNEGGTALIYASVSKNSNAETVKALIVAGSDVKQKDNDGKMAVDYARNNPNLKGTDALRRLEELSK